MKKIMKKILALFVGMAVLFTAIPYTDAAATEKSPNITVTDATVTAGSYAYMYVIANDVSDLVGIEYTLYYDADVMTLNYAHANSSFISGSTIDINLDNPGEIKYSLMNIDGLSGTGQLLRICFQVNADAKEGTYPITITIGDAYNSSFETISFSKNAATLTINGTITDATSIVFYDECDKTTAKEGDVITYILKGGYTYGLACGNFEFRYDKDLLQLSDVSLGEELQTSTAIYTINKETEGYVKISYADIEAISSSYGIEYVTLTFTVKANVDNTTNIEFAADSLVDVNLANMVADGLTRIITLETIEEELVSPAIRLEVNTMNVDGSFTVDVILEKKANVAAGDFTITYDNTQVLCQSIEIDEALTSNGGYMITNDTLDEGYIKFSYVNMNPFTEEQRIAVLEFKAVGAFYGTISLEIAGKDVVDANYTDIIMEYESLTVDVPERKPPTAILKVSGAYFKVNNGVTQTINNYTQEYDVGTQITLTATADNFAYWMNESNKIVSTSTDYTFNLWQNATITVVYKSAIANETAFVEFVSDYGQVIQAQNYAATSDITLPDGPSKLGYAFDSWSMSVADIQKAIADGETYIRVTPLYEKLSGSFNVKVIYDNDEANAEIYQDVDGYEFMQLTAKEIEGRQFAYWSDATQDGSVLGRSATYYLYVQDNVTVYAVYVDAGVELEKTPISTITNSYASNVSEIRKVHFEVSREIPDGYSLQEHGALYGTNSSFGESDAGELMVVDNSDVRKSISTSTASEGIYILSVNVGTKVDTVVYARGYMILQNEMTGEVVTVYSRIVSGSYNSLNGAEL